MSQSMRAVIPADISHAAEASLAFIIDRHKAKASLTDDHMMEVVLESQTDPLDLFRARCEELAFDLSYYRCGVGKFEIAGPVDAEFVL